jgi:acyl-CoA hydrolase
MSVQDCPYILSIRVVNPTSADTLDWHRILRPGDRVVCSHMTAEPAALLRALAASQAHDGRFEVFLGVPFSDAASGFAPAATFTTFGAMGSAGALARGRATRISTAHYSQCGDAFASGASAADAVLVSLARDAAGRLCLGASHGYVLDAARRARVVVAEINALAPAVAGAPWPDEIAIGHRIETSYPLAVAAEPRVSEVERRIAGHVAALVPEGACLQVGIGSLASAVVEGLREHRFLGVHSGMLTPALQALVESGGADNSRKEIDTGVSVTACVYGDAALYAAVHEHPALRLREPRYTHGREVIARLGRFVALNSALEVDLLGQANAETAIGSDGNVRQVGGVGGLNDFVRGARAAPDGKAIIALPARQPARAGVTGPGAARIVARLSGPATVAAADADIVVTEYGSAHLRHASLGERARRLIAIAHPDDRDALAAAARKLALGA